MFSLTTLSKYLGQRATRLFIRRSSKVSALTLLFSLALGSLSYPGIVSAHTKSSSCSGSGQILSGEGRGGIVSLVLSRSRAGSDMYNIQLRRDYFGGDSFSIRPYSTISRSYGSWIAEEISSSQMFLTLQHRQPYAVVSYVLRCR
jgi:hypothetical protein